MTDPLDALVLAHERGRDLREEAAAERLRRSSGTRRALAASLRREADRLDPAPAGEPAVRDAVSPADIAGLTYSSSARSTGRSPRTIRYLGEGHARGKIVITV